MTGADAAADQLDLLISGKRSAPRHEVELAVLVKGVNREFEAVARDVSEGGVLLEIAESELAGEADTEPGAAGHLELIEAHFRDSFDVQFTGRGVVAEAALVRLSVRPHEPGMLYLGCQFAHLLSDELQSKLGVGRVDGIPAWHNVPALGDLPFEADPSRPAYLMILDETEAVAGPRYMGPLTAMGPDLLVARIDGTTCDDVTACLAGRALRVRVMCGARVIWEAEASMLATRFLDGRRQGTEVAVSLKVAPGRRVRKLLRRRDAA